MTLAFDLPENPGTAWTAYTVPLRAGAGWKVGDGKGKEATEEQIRDVLSNLKTVKIRGEYREGEDTGGLDTVVLKR